MEQSYKKTGNANIVTLKRDGYDPFIDFMKGASIILVVLTHCFSHKLREYTLFYLWGYPAVPIFLIIQVFHTYKQGLDNVKIDYKKLWHRIISPFLKTEIIILCLMAIKNYFLGGQTNTGFVLSTIKCGGLGPGSFYPWIYLQFAFILIIITPIFKRYGGILLSIVFVVVSEFLELFCSIINCPEYIYRLLFIRYFMIIYLGYVLVCKGYIINKSTQTISLLSVASVCFLVYSGINLSPFIFDTGWKWCHWMCYYYIAYLAIPFLYRLYISSIIRKRYTGLFDYIKRLGRYSYDIFLFNMIYFEFLDGIMIRALSVFINSNTSVRMISMFFALIICLYTVVVYKDWRFAKLHSRKGLFFLII